MTLSNSSKADLLLLCVTLLAAISWLFSKEAIQLMPPLLFLCLRFLLAGCLLLAIGPGALLRLAPRQLLRAAKVGVFFGAGMSCWVMGLYYGSHVGIGAFLTSLGVVLVPVFGRLLFAEHAPASTWAALPVAVVGLGLLSIQEAGRFDWGQLFYVAAAIVFAIYFNLNTHAANTQVHEDASGNRTETAAVPARILTAIVLIEVGLIAGLLSALMEPWQATLDTFNSDMLLWVVLSAVIGSAARFLLQTYAQSLARHSHGVIIMVVEPVWTALFAAAWFAEQMTPSQLSGCALIFAALLVSRGKALRQALKAWLS